jgi:hypothetical protein
MSTENVITIVVAVLSSGLISTLLNRHWSVVDKKDAQARATSEEVQKEKAQQELNARMLKKLFRANLNRTINCVRDKLEDPNVSDARLRLYITELHDDMEDYFEMGGNGATHAAYVELYNEIRELKPELISLAWLDFIADEVK